MDDNTDLSVSGMREMVDTQDKAMAEQIQDAVRVAKEARNQKEADAALGRAIREQFGEGVTVEDIKMCVMVLDGFACWSLGPKVKGSFDAPWVATAARQALARLRGKD